MVLATGLSLSAFSTAFASHPPSDASAAESYGVAPEASKYRLFSFNDLGMHCYDSDFSVLSFLPLFNVLRAQVIQVGPRPRVLTKLNARVFYRAQADRNGSINRTSRRKTNFWRYAGALFGAKNLRMDQGLLGAKMPGARNARQPFAAFNGSMRWFGAEGIPITSYDDAKKKNSYPLMNVFATAPGSNKVVAGLSTVLPVSDEMQCERCHATGKQAARAAGITWSKAADITIQSRENILILHDNINLTNLYNNQPQLCASCHYSKALDLSNSGPSPKQKLHAYMSHAIHRWHAVFIPDQPARPNAACYSCHPGNKTKCLRGVMAASGIECIDCHGNLTAVGRSDRTPWVDEPKCQSCHTGDALNHMGNSLRLRTAYANSPDIATPRVAKNKRFAENAAPKNRRKALLYRNSLGHGGVACAACHGSPHAEWPTLEPNDNIAALELQGHKGTITECAVCHGPNQKATMRGPHGMHNVNSQTWATAHGGFMQTARSRCQACHGMAGKGTVLSIARANRGFVFGKAGRIVRIPSGTRVSCNLCHRNPLP
jgi:hypothetical protein